MRLIAVHLPDRIVTDIQELVDKGLYPNRSEAIRIAIRDLLKRELWDQNLGKKARMSGQDTAACVVCDKGSQREQGTQ